MNNKDATLIGLVTELDVFSFTDQSAQLQFKIAPPNGPEQTFVMETLPNRRYSHRRLPFASNTMPSCHPHILQGSSCRSQGNTLIRSRRVTLIPYPPTVPTRTHRARTTIHKRTSIVKT
jgi:hypothetical protein